MNDARKVARRALCDAVKQIDRKHIADAIATIRGALNLLTGESDFRQVSDADELTSRERRVRRQEEQHALMYARRRAIRHTP